jgi:class 3 adenylate cyclase
MERRLAAIFAADVAGYSRLIGVDEEGTLERLRAHRRELIDPKIAEHQGRGSSSASESISATWSWRTGISTAMG